MVLFYKNLFIYLMRYPVYFTSNVLNYWIFSICSSKGTNVNCKVDISECRRDYSNINKNPEYYLTSYLAGLIEGDGHFNVPKSLKNSKGKAISGGIEVIFALKDRPSAELLKTKFGGNLYLRANRNLVRWMIQDIKSISYIMNAINGKLRTPKINAFYDMVDFLKLKGVNIEKLPLDTSHLSSNAWLAGFIDADGHFAIKGFTENPKTYLGIQFYLPQRRTDKSGDSFEKTMLQIAEFLSTKLSQREITSKYLQFIVNTSSAKSNKNLIDYLNIFPLLSSKYLDYKDWESANSIYVNKLHKDPVEFQKVRTLKNNMNSNRTFFDWSHLRQEIYGLV